MREREYMIAKSLTLVRVALTALRDADIPADRCGQMLALKRQAIMTIDGMRILLADALEEVLRPDEQDEEMPEV